ncbi:MAG: trypsin-like peptidase domain-containing protein [Planctomycetales bacterium]|nr:trypsin-like peptidase domain-containing protein [Planctomycetales bacterium]
MSQIVLVCPHCSMRLGTNSLPAAGTALTCPTCKKQFAAPEGGPAVPKPAPPKPAPPVAAAPRPAPPRAAPPKPPQIQQPPAPFPAQPIHNPLPKPAYIPPAYPAYQQPNYGQQSGASSSGGGNKGLIIGLSVGGAVVALLFLVTAIVVHRMNRATPVAQKSSDAPAGVPSSGTNSGTNSALPGLVPAGSSTAPFSATPTSSGSVRQLPIVGASTVLAYRWAAEKNYDYDYQLTSSADGTVSTYGGIATYKHNAVKSGVLARAIGAEGGGEGSGTAFVVHADGLLVTCAHVVRGTTKVSVTVGSQTYPGDVVGVDDRHDLALIRVPGANLPTVPLGNSDTVQLAEEVRAVGYPLSDVLGTSVKITRGSIAGIVTKNGDRTMQIDASINPGNSGGPLFNDRGEVVGINSAGLFGDSIASVGFAVPVNYAHALLRSKGISIPTASGTKVLTGPALANAVTPAVAYVKVDMAKGETLQLLEYKGFCMKSSPGNIGRPSNNVVNDTGRLIIAPTGEILDSNTEVQFPLLMMPISKIAIEKLPSDGDREWESRRLTPLFLPNKPTESISPFGPGGSSRSGRYSRSPIPRPSQPGMVIIPAMEQIKYTIASETADTIEITKTLDISSMDPEGGVPSLQIAGSGNITWDKKNGAPRLIKQSMHMNINVGGAKVTVPLDLKVELIGVTTDAERPEMLKKRGESMRGASPVSTSPVVGSTPTIPNRPTQSTPAPPATPSPPARAKKSLDDYIAAIKSTDHSFGQMYLPLSELSFMEPVPERREEVAALLNPLLDAKNESVRSSALNAVKKWGTQKNVPTLLKMLEWKSLGDRWAAMEALGNIGGSKEAAQAIAALMLDQGDMLTAAHALEKMGPVAEDAVWPHVGSNDRLLHSNACRVLGAVGTQKSLDKLQPLIKKETDIGHRVPMEIASRDIVKRLGK